MFVGKSTMSVVKRHTARRFALWLSFLSVCLSTCPSVAGSLDSVRCYVWDFATRNGTRNEVTRQLTVEFEEKLTQKNFCRVLERRNYARLIAQKDNEKAVMQAVECSGRKQCCPSPALRCKGAGKRPTNAAPGTMIESLLAATSM